MGVETLVMLLVSILGVTGYWVFRGPKITEFEIFGVWGVLLVCAVGIHAGIPQQVFLSLLVSAGMAGAVGYWFFRRQDGIQETSESEIEARLEDYVDLMGEVEHKRWAHWQNWMHSQGRKNPENDDLTIPGPLVRLWERQIKTSYADLAYSEQESDRDIARRAFPVIAGILAGRGDEMVKDQHHDAVIHNLILKRVGLRKNTRTKRGVSNET